MTKKAIGFIIVLISLVLVSSLSANGPNSAGKDKSLVALTDSEIDHLTYMREEEKLARDVYLTLSAHYETGIFINISESEQRHMDALERLIVKYGLEDPVVNDDIGAFTNPDFAGLYEQLVARGIADYCEALQVGIDIERLDIDDINEALIDIEAQDLERVLNNLLLGSENHLNAFTGQYEANHCE